jgi:cell division protein FtsB
MRSILLVLAIAGFAMQGQLWISSDGYRQTRDLRAAVIEQRQENQSLRERNKALEAEVINLKVSREAAEERARSDLGLIGKSETFYQVVPASSSVQ